MAECYGVTYPQYEGRSESFVIRWFLARPAYFLASLDADRIEQTFSVQNKLGLSCTAVTAFKTKELERLGF